jgi:hypothetical protein
LEASPGAGSFSSRSRERRIRIVAHILPRWPTLCARLARSAVPGSDFDALDGKAASLSKRGYVVPAFGSVTIDGFRTSLDTVAAFRFSSVSDSYAGRKGEDRNVGVIGVAFFRERVEPPVEVTRPWGPPRRSRSAEAAPAPQSKSAAPSAGAAREGRGESMKRPTDRPGLGTEFGETRESRVRETFFVRESEQPSATNELRYNDRRGLRALGIRIDPEPEDTTDDELDLRETAQPFPRDRRFAEPPP